MPGLKVNPSENIRTILMPEDLVLHFSRPFLVRSNLVYKFSLGPSTPGLSFNQVKCQKNHACYT